MEQQQRLIGLAVEKLDTKRELSKHLGILPQTLNKYINEGRDMPSRHIFKMLGLLSRSAVYDLITQIRRA